MHLGSTQPPISSLSNDRRQLVICNVPPECTANTQSYTRRMIGCRGDGEDANVLRDQKKPTTNLPNIPYTIPGVGGPRTTLLPWGSSTSSSPSCTRQRSTPFWHICRRSGNIVAPMIGGTVHWQTEGETHMGRTEPTVLMLHTVQKHHLALSGIAQIRPVWLIAHHNFGGKGSPILAAL